MARPRSVYRGENSRLWIVTLIVSALVVLILLAVWLFYDLQKYIVYDKDGLQLVLPSAVEPATPADDGSEGAVPLPAVDVEIVVDPADYSGFAGTDGSGLQPLHARYVPAERVTEAALGAYASDMGGYNALVLELKSATGTLSYHSALPLADSYGVNGTAEIAERVAELKENGVWLVAELAALTDGSMAVRNAPIALRDAASGGLYLKDGQTWLDPYSGVARAYLSGLMEELAEMGFDEILLSGFWIREDENLRYSAAMTATPGAADAVSALAVYLRGQADALGVRLSVKWEGASSQDADLFFRAFDRVAYDYADADAAAALSAVPGVDGDTRIVAAASGVTPERASYLVK